MRVLAVETNRGKSSFRQRGFLFLFSDGIGPANYFQINNDLPLDVRKENRRTIWEQLDSISIGPLRRVGFPGHQSARMEDTKNDHREKDHGTVQSDCEVGRQRL